jgi:hypothetical protein
MIGLESNKSNVHAIHITKNAYIKLHVNKRDMDYSIIGWLTKHAPSGGYFQVHQLWYRFSTSHDYQSSFGENPLFMEHGNMRNNHYKMGYVTS